MKIRKLLALLLTTLLLLSLAACSAGSSAVGTDKYYNSAVGDDYAAEAPELSESKESVSASLPENQKLIQKVWLTAETEEMDSLLTHINQRISALGGYVEAQNIYNGSSYSGRKTRTADLTIRIPADNLNQFVEQVGEASNIVSSNKTTENVTLSYVATESRMKALEVEQTRLLELMEKAETMKDLLTIEERLTEVRTELERVTSQLRLYDNMVDYATIYLDITEVREYTEPVAEPETLWDRISTGFAESMENLGKGLENLLVALIVSIPYLIPFAVIAIVVLVILLMARRKKKHKRPPENTPTA